MLLRACLRKILREASDSPEGQSEYSRLRLSLRNSLGRTGTGRELFSPFGGSAEEDKEVDELGEEEEEEPPEVGDVSSAVKTPKAAARDTSPESDLQRLRVLL